MSNAAHSAALQVHLALLVAGPWLATWIVLLLQSPFPLGGSTTLLNEASGS